MSTDGSLTPHPPPLTEPSCFLFRPHRDICLNVPINRSVVERLGCPQRDERIESAYLYPTLNPTASSGFSVKALHDYTAKRFDELSFCKHAIITNVVKEESGWWKGDYGGKRQHWFPANYVQPVVMAQPLEESASESGSTGSSAEGEDFPAKGTRIMGPRFH